MASQRRVHVNSHRTLHKSGATKLSKLSKLSNLSKLSKHSKLSKLSKLSKPIARWRT